MRLARHVLPLAAAAFWIASGHPARAEFSYRVIIVNNSAAEVTVKLGYSTNWNAGRFATPRDLPPRTTSVAFNTSDAGSGSNDFMKVSLLDGTGDGSPVESARLYFAGANTPLPDDWWGDRRFAYPGKGKVMAANMDTPVGAVLVEALDCAYRDDVDRIDCTLSLNDALFSSNKPKYAYDDKRNPDNGPEIGNARTYFVDSEAKHDAIIFGSYQRDLFTADFKDGNLAYVNPSFIPLNGYFPVVENRYGTLTTTTPDCTLNGAVGHKSSNLYVFLDDLTFVTVGTCDERFIKTFPMVYTTDTVATSGQVNRFDNQVPNDEAIAEGYLAITHGGVAGYDYGADPQTNETLISIRQVRSAGEMVVGADGTVLSINNDSGHFRPSEAALDAMVTYLREAKGAGGAFEGEKTCADGVCTYRAATRGAAPAAEPPQDEAPR